MLNQQQLNFELMLKRLIWIGKYMIYISTTYLKNTQNQIQIQADQIAKLNKFQNTQILLKNNLRYLEQFRKNLIQQQTYLMKLKIQDFSFSYNEPIALIRGQNNESWQLKYYQVEEQLWKSRAMQTQIDQRIHNILKKQMEIKEQLYIEQDKQIVECLQNQIMRFNQHIDRLCEVQRKLLTLQAYHFQSRKKISENIKNKQKNQNLGIQLFKSKFWTIQGTIIQNLKYFYKQLQLIQNKNIILKMSDQKFKQLIKKDIQNQIEIIQSTQSQNQTLINQLQSLLLSKRQNFCSYYNYHNDSQSFKEVSIKKFIQQFNNIEREIKECQNGIKYTIQNIRKFNKKIQADQITKLNTFQNTQILLKNNLRYLEQFRKNLIQQQTYLMKLKIQDFSFSYNEPIALIRGQNNESWQLKYYQVEEQLWKSRAMQTQIDQRIHNILKKQMEIKEQLYIEQDKQIVECLQNQIMRFNQHIDRLCEVQRKLLTLQAYHFQSRKKISENIKNKQKNQNLGIQLFKSKFWTIQGTIIQNLKYFYKQLQLIQNKNIILKMSDQKFKQLIKKDIQNQIEIIQSTQSQNQTLINQLQSLLLSKRQNFCSYYNYHNDSQSFKEVSIKKFIQQFNNIEREIKECQNGIKYTIQNIRKFNKKIQPQYQKNEKLKQSKKNSDMQKSISSKSRQTTECRF